MAWLSDRRDITITSTEQVDLIEISAVVTILTSSAVAFTNSVVVGDIGVDVVYVSVKNEGNTVVTVKPRFRNSYFTASPTVTDIEPGEIRNFSVYARPYVIGNNKDVMYFTVDNGVSDDTVSLECIGTSAIDVINPVFPLDSDVDISHNDYIRFRTDDTYGLYRDHLTVIINDAVVIKQGQFMSNWSGDIISYGTNNWDITIDGPESWGLNKTVVVEVYVLNYMGQRGYTSYSFSIKVIGEQQWNTTSDFLSNIRHNPTPTYYMEAIEDDGLEVKPISKMLSVQALSKRSYIGATFNGTTSNIKFGNNWNLGSTWTIEAWFKIFSYSSVRRGIFGSATVTNPWSFAVDADGFIVAYVEASNGTTVNLNSGIVAIPGNAYHCAVTYDGYVINVFVNGERVLTSHDVYVNYTGNNYPYVGGEYSYGSNDFHGDIWDVRAWTINRTADEIAANFYKKLYGSETNLRDLWLLDGNSTDLVGTVNGTDTDIAYVAESGEIESDIISYNEEVNFSELNWKIGGRGGSTIPNTFTFQVAVLDTLDTPSPDDTFTNSVIDTSKWEVADGTPYISSGALRCDVESGSTNSEGIKSTYYLEGDFDVQVDYDIIAGPSTDGWYAGLQVIDTNGHIVQMSRHYTSSDRYGIRYYNAITDTWDTETQTTTSDTSGKLRLVREDGVTTGYYWTGAWTAIGNRNVVGDGLVQVSLNVENIVGNPATSITFDNFVVNLGNLAPKWNYVGPDNTSSTYFTDDDRDLSFLSGRYLRYKVILPADHFSDLSFVSVSVFSYWQVQYNLYHQKVLRQVQVDRLSNHPGMEYRLKIKASNKLSTLSTASWSDWLQGYETFPDYVIFDIESLYLLCNAYEIRVEATINSTLRFTDDLEAETVDLDNLRQQETEWLTADYPSYSLDLTEDWEITMAWSKDREVSLTDASNYIIDDLDGDTEKMYMIILYGFITANSGNHIIGLRPNGDTITGNYGRGIQSVVERASGTTYNNTPGWTGGTEAILPLGHNKWSDDGRFMARGIINAESTMYRVIRSEWSFVRDGYDDYLLSGHATNMWEDASTNITFLTLHFDGASDFDGKLILFSLRV